MPSKDTFCISHRERTTSETAGSRGGCASQCTCCYCSLRGKLAQHASFFWPPPVTGQLKYSPKASNAYLALTCARTMSCLLALFHSTLTKPYSPHTYRDSKRLIREAAVDLVEELEPDRKQLQKLRSYPFYSMTSFLSLNLFSARTAESLGKTMSASSPKWASFISWSLHTDGCQGTCPTESQ